ncbi:hypothetical protein ASC95_04905 [Pelomonas sp. Root1217]|uniref:hypothetical protein n=1 Tax=Pelomonas sp. Root1217 TaxID=1736430 RepID=UPI000708B821|nr:hypothetical protein [Pelomonas sp. Root1217]KQV60774.1 hypothetical protein ASC95_04905 [Pelomonas sp. Root1217]
MRLRVLLTNGKRTVDLIWLDHNGTDIYYGGVGWSDKTSYHASGIRHRKARDGTLSPIQRHHRLDSFSGQLQLCVFGFHTKFVESDAATPYKGKKGDSVIFLDSRSLPDQVGVSLGLLEAGAYAAMLPIHQHLDLRLIHLATNTTPWIYVAINAINGQD